MGDDHFSPAAREGRRPAARAGARAVSATITRRLSAERTGQAPGLLFCLAPQEVFRAPGIAPGAVGSYPAVSPLPGACAPGGLVSVTLSVAAGLRPPCPRILRGLLPGGVRTFLPGANPGRPPAITAHYSRRCAEGNPGFHVLRHSHPRCGNDPPWKGSHRLWKGNNPSWKGSHRL